MVDVVDFKKMVKDVENKHNLSYFEVLQRFMFERVLERISVSKYRDNFILKGGLLLSAMFGIDNRMTKDIDASITGINVSKDEMLMNKKQYKNNYNRKSNRLGLLFFVMFWYNLRVM